MVIQERKLKREAVNAFTNTQSKTSSLFSPHPMVRQGSHCCNYFRTVTPSYHCKVTPIGVLHAEKLGKEFCSMCLQYYCQHPSLYLFCNNPYLFISLFMISHQKHKKTHLTQIKTKLKNWTKWWSQLVEGMVSTGLPHLVFNKPSVVTD